MKVPVPLLWVLIWMYIASGGLLILMIVCTLFVLPLFTFEAEVSQTFLDLLEKILLGWGITLYPLLKFGQSFLKK